DRIRPERADDSRQSQRDHSRISMGAGGAPGSRATYSRACREGTSSSQSGSPLEVCLTEPVRTIFSRLGDLGHFAMAAVHMTSKLSKPAFAAVLMAACAIPVWAAAGFRIVQQNGTDLIHISLSKSGHNKLKIHKLEIDDA